MEEKEGLNGSGVTVKGDEASHGYRVEPRVENSTQYGGSTAQPTPAAPPVSVAAPTSDGKKKRGRPRKYAGDASIVALSPMPLSASIPLTGDYSAWKHSAARPVDSFKKKHKLEFGSQGIFTSFDLRLLRRGILLCRELITWLRSLNLVLLCIILVTMVKELDLDICFFLAWVAVCNFLCVYVSTLYNMFVSILLGTGPVFGGPSG